MYSTVGGSPVEVFLQFWFVPIGVGNFLGEDFVDEDDDVVGEFFTIVLNLMLAPPEGQRVIREDVLFKFNSVQLFEKLIAGGAGAGGWDDKA